MNTSVTALSRTVDLDETIADCLVEALATTADREDPFEQAAAVAEHLWDRGIVLARATTTTITAATTAAFWTIVGLASATAVHATALPH